MTSRQFWIATAFIGLLAIIGSVRAQAGIAENPVGENGEERQLHGFYFPDFNADGLYRVACLGDSNTVSFFWRDWCALLGSKVGDPRLGVLNLAAMGAKAAGDVGNQGSRQLLNALRNPEVDAVIISFGTNDLRDSDTTPAEVLAQYQEMASLTERAGRAFYVATTPPCVAPEDRPPGDEPTLDSRIRELNLLVRKAFPSERVIEFHDGFPTDRFAADGVHVDQKGQHIRSTRVAERIYGPVRCDRNNLCHPPRICFRKSNVAQIRKATGESFKVLRSMLPDGACVVPSALRAAAVLGRELADDEWRAGVADEVTRRSIRSFFACRDSEACSERGACAATMDPEQPGDFHCQATWQEHCTASLACKRAGRCFLLEGECVSAPEPGSVQSHRGETPRQPPG